jgi:selenide,water dikinase
MTHPDLMVGFEHFSDAGVYRLRPDLAIVQTVDFFPPIVNDAADFGAIAAANALSDVYAMGATPITALSIVGFPDKELEMGVLGEILAAGARKVIEAGAVIVGGHSVTDAEIKYGLAVTGIVHPGRVIQNSGARAGDRLVLTKAIGMGSVSTAIKEGKLGEDAVRRAVAAMATLNRDARDLMVEHGARGATDITGFGLLGHARELAEASGVTVRLRARDVPVFQESPELARRGLLSGGARRNRKFIGDRVRIERGVPPELEELLFDSETSGGLLISLAPDAAEKLVEAMHARGREATRIVGDVVEKRAWDVEVQP